MGTFRNKVINHGALLQVEGRKLTIELNESYPYQSEVLSVLGKLRCEAKLRELKKVLRRIPEDMEFDTQKDVEILNDHVLFKMAEHIGISGIIYDFIEKIEDVIEFVSPCNSKAFYPDIKVQLIQDFR